MSATANPSTDASTTDDLSKEERLKRYLLSRAEDGEMYFKGKFISDDVDLSPKEIGALMVKLRDSATELTVEKWSYTGATTWRRARLTGSSPPVTPSRSGALGRVPAVVSLASRLPARLRRRGVYTR